MLIRRARLKEEEMNNMDPEKLIYLEVKLDMLVSAVEEMMQKNTTRNEYNVQAHDLLIE